MRLPASTEADILAEANRPDRAPYTAIHVTRSLARRLHGALPLVIDDSVPFPGYEVHRAAP